MSSNNIAFVRNYTSVIDERCQPTDKSVCGRVSDYRESFK